MLFTFPSRSLVRSPKDVEAFVAQLIRRLAEEGLYYAGPNRRTERRHAVALRVRAMPLDDKLQPAGEAFVATSRNISSRGIALIHVEKVTHPYLAVELTDVDGKTFEAAVEVLRCQPQGSYYEIAGQFVTKVYNPFE